MRFFFISIADTRREFIESALNVISHYNRRLGVEVGVLVRWTKWRKVKPLYGLHERYGVKLFVDSAGFEQLVGGDVSNPLFPYKYASWFNRFSDTVDYVAVPDIPVHGRREFFNKHKRMRLINETIKRSKLFVSSVEDKDKVILVLQGYEVDEYKYSLSMYLGDPVFHDTRSLAHGNGDYYRVLAVGSVCVRKPESAGKTTVIAGGLGAGTLFKFMDEFLGSKWQDWIRGFHFFGLHTSAIRRYGRHKLFYGSDTGAYGLNFKWKWKTTLGCEKPDAKCYAKAIEKQILVSLRSLLNKDITKYI